MMDVRDEDSLVSSLSSSITWKFLWQPQAAHLSAPLVPSSPLAMNSLHPSKANPPMLAAWFFWHSPYLTPLLIEEEPPLLLWGSSPFFDACWCFFMPSKNCNSITNFFD